MTWGDQSFKELIPFFLFFQGLFLYTEMLYKSHAGSAVLTLIETMLFFCIPSDIHSSQVIYIIFWPRGLLTFYDPF